MTFYTDPCPVERNDKQNRAPELRILSHQVCLICLPEEASLRHQSRCVMPEIIMVLGQIPLVPYMTPATGDLAGIVSDYIQKDHRAVLLENHGVLVTGNDVFDACNNLTLVETYAKTYINALSIGNINTLSESQVKRLNELKKGLNFETTSVTCNLETTNEPGSRTMETGDSSLKELADMITDAICKEISKKGKRL